ncbi:MAG TPA: AMP-binding protein [Quisquiliibacterium sp.]|nr:AMP-binding protein [Quisquiliibacterium sp.]
MDRIDDPHVLIPDILASHAAFHPRREAVVCGPVRRSWGDFGANIERVASALQACGVGRGDKVAVLMGNSVEMLEIIFGIVRAGACVVPLSGLLTGPQLATLLDDSGSVMVFATADFRAKVDPERGRLRGVRPDGWIAVFGDAPDWQGFDTFLAGARASAPLPVCTPADDFNIIYSSGTTGLPKGIVQTHRARTHWAFSNAIEMGFTDRTRALTTTSLYSNGTWLMMLPALFVGGTCVVMPAFDPAGFLETVARERITHAFMVPSQYIAVLAEPRLDASDTSSLQVLLCAGSPLRRETKREVIRRFGNKLYELYGFSEGYASMLKPQHDESKFETVGTPVLGFEVRILDDAGNALPRGQVGEIAAYGAGMMKAYHRRPEQTAELIWKDERGRSFIRSGDIGRLDEDGFLTLLDRKKDMVISGGFNVFPADIEQVVAGHPAVLDVTVIGIPHEKWGETPIALVIRRDGAQATEAEIADWANERLAKHQRVSRVEFRDEFPRNALGKVLKRLLREPYWGASPASAA